VDYLLEHQITGAPVVDDDGQLVGLLTEKDCLRLVARGVDAEIPKGSGEDFCVTRAPSDSVERLFDEVSVLARLGLAPISFPHPHRAAR
jgi:Mg/Co/Ni transporter MgtE